MKHWRVRLKHRSAGFISSVKIDVVAGFSFAAVTVL